MAVAFFGGLYLLYLILGSDAGSFVEWLQSGLTSGTFALNAVIGNYMDKAVNLIAGFEGFRARAYPDPPGQTATYSIGYGHQIRPGDGLSLETVMTEPDAKDLLSRDAQSAADCLASSCVVFDSLSDNQKAALVSFIYNEGCGAFQNSTMLRMLNAGDEQGASLEFDRWVYAGGVQIPDLVDRRAKEQELFNS